MERINHEKHEETRNIFKEDASPDVVRQLTRSLEERPMGEECLSVKCAYGRGETERGIECFK